METSEHAEEQSKSDELKRQSTDHDVSTDLFLFALPVVRARNGRTIALDDEGYDIADDENRSQPSAGNT